MSAMSTPEEIVRELETFYRHYIDVFNREDPGFFDCFAQPYAMISGERGLAAVANDDDNRRKLRAHDGGAPPDADGCAPASTASRRGRWRITSG